MLNHHGSDHLANSSWADLAWAFSDLDANTPSNSSTQLYNPPSPLHNLFTNDQNQPLIHPFGDNIALDPASMITEPAFPMLPPLTTSNGNARVAESCNYTHHNLNPSAVTLSPVSNLANFVKGGHDVQDEVAFARACMLAITASVDYIKPMSRASAHSSLSDFGLGASKGVSFKQSGKQRPVVSESVRRKQMTRLFYTLRSLLPNIVPQHDRCNVIEKTCDYIKSLERKLQVLKRKAEILASIMETSSELKSKAEESNGGTVMRPASPGKPCKLEAPHVQITLAENTFININIGCYEKKRGLFPVLLNILGRKHLEVLSANRSQQGQAVLYAIHVKPHEQSRFPSELELEELKVELYTQASKMLL